MMQDGSRNNLPGSIKLDVNGRTRDCSVPPLQPLAETLRSELALTGTKVGCDAGDCGACTVLVDGEAVCACLVPTAQVAGRRIDTVEGTGPRGITDTLREAFLARGAAQCGICTPGMLMAATALLASNRTPDRVAVEDAIGGVLCRCTGYAAILDAVLGVVAQEAPAAEVRAGLHNPVGQRLTRTDGRTKVDGTDIFGADAAPVDALWMRVIRSPHHRARFTLGDLEGFRRGRPGLEAILSSRDVPGENTFGIFPTMKDQPVLAPGHVRFRGEAVLALVGTSAALAAIEDSELPITWEPLPPLLGVEAALANGAPALHPTAPDNILTRGFLCCGDTEKGRSSAAVDVSGEFETGFVEHAYIEPEAGYAVRVGDRIEVTACTQAPYMDLEEVARVLGLPFDAVRIIPTACGGGFGGKLDVSVQPLLAVAAWHLRRPVRIIYTRTESMASTTKRHPSMIRARMSADAQGRFVAFESSADFNTGAYASWGPTVASRVPVHASGPYKVANVRNESRAIFTNEAPSGAFRGFGVPQAALATEMLIDDIAERLRMDRWKLRRLNAIGKGDATPTGQVLDHSAGLPECLDALESDWKAAVARADEHNRSNTRLRRGVGIACMWYGCGNTSMSNPSSMRVVLDRDGQLTLFNGAVDIGQGSTTILLQICAEAVGLPLSQFNVVVGDTDLTLDAGKTSASRQTLVSGNAARLAGLDLRSRILAMANAGPDAQLALAGRFLEVVDGEASRRIDLSVIPESLEGFGTWDPPTTPLDANGQGVPYATYGFGAQMAEVEVDTSLGTVKVIGIVAAHDVGRAINPALTEGQIEGGIAQGLGLALMEEFIPGRTENLHDYLIPTAGDVPPIKIHLIEDHEPLGPYGAKGVGEPALIATAPAILSAIRHATGVTMHRVPVLPHRLWEAIEAARQAA